MEYRDLSRVRDTYPGEPDTVSENYTSDDRTIRLTGEYPQNFINFDVTDISDINVADVQTSDALSFRFIVQFFDRNNNVEQWTSPRFLEELQIAKRENNPYFSYDVSGQWPANKVTIVRIDITYLSRYSTTNQFLIPELYAEVRVLDTITTREDMLIHINWMVSSNENLRPIEDFGTWVVETTDLLGFDHSDELESLQNGEPTIRPSNPGPLRSNQNTTLAEPRGDSSNTSIRSDGVTGTRTDTRSNTTNTGTRGTTTATPRNTTPRSTTTSTPIRTRSASSNMDYTPFNTAGRYTGETRTLNGVLYIWGDNKWNVINN